MIAREYGFAGWQDLTAEVSKRVGGLEWAVAQAERVIHDNDVERLRQLLAEYPALLSWRADRKGRGVLGMATSSYASTWGNPQRERDFTRAACAELLIDAGAVVAPSVCESILQSRARGLLALFQRKGLLPRTLEFFAALGDIDAVRTALDDNADPAAVNEAFVRACLFDHEAVASLLLERCHRCSIPSSRQKSTEVSGARPSSSVLSQRGPTTSGDRRARENGWAVEDVRHGAGQPRGPG